MPVVHKRGVGADCLNAGLAQVQYSRINVLPDHRGRRRDPMTVASALAGHAETIHLTEDTPRTN